MSSPSAPGRFPVSEPAGARAAVGPKRRIALNESASVLPAIGRARVKLVARILGLEGDVTVGELLTLYPREHYDRRRMTLVRELRHGEQASVDVKIIDFPSDRRTPSGKTVTQVPVSDGSGILMLGWFNQPFIKKKLKLGDRYIISGKPEKFGPEARITQPEMEKIEDRQVLSAGRIVPVYPLTDGLQQPMLRLAMRSALDIAVPPTEFIPATIRQALGLMGIRDAVENIHYPATPEMLQAARRRLKFEELFLLQTSLACRKALAQSRPGIKMKIDEPVAREIRGMVPFDPTSAQKRVVREIFADLVRSVPMNRLLQGDVGSGKTIVAAIAIIAVVRNHCQTALMAPTEILAEQHYATLKGLLEPLDIAVHLLTSNVTGNARAAVFQSAQEEPCVVVGTHALIQDGVSFGRLGLVIVDEQHRFGVEQRLKIQEKGRSDEDPHVLVMTATPIPRTLSLTAYGHLDVSIIDEMPPGRKPIRTQWASQNERAIAYDDVREQIEAGRQAYVVCPLVDVSDRTGALSALQWQEELQKEVFPGLQVDLVHGKLRSDLKDAAMRRFRTGETHVLVATTVIEVGVDVPNATVMVIEDANRFGLAQLHQLRGRVGRGEFEGSCYLITDERFNPRRSSRSALFPEGGPDELEVGQRRMKVLVESCDGFRIAEEDFRLRGVGIYFGTRQHGRSRLRIADLHRDLKLLQEAREAASRLVKSDPYLDLPEHALLRGRVAELELMLDLEEDFTAVA